MKICRKPDGDRGVVFFRRWLNLLETIKSGDYFSENILLFEGFSEI